MALRRQAITLAVEDEDSPLYGVNAEDVVVRSGRLQVKDALDAAAGSSSRISCRSWKKRSRAGPWLWPKSSTAQPR
ncbi:hypothetical protein H0H10_02880 [Streptomyces sp. TRM S81-3]|uniref:Uncharacterized protein n=1 Tax=Streptomyces griseicoloratus TaxID=2752516 RepID=A0A926KWS2_9ACTN|nr:hypothetical protein [Streptomyces griseicoloratus]MBD0418123.1 hypothetical protein [Streptomyces griseicoloratus]